MTLVQMVADETAVHMSCDFCLTDYLTRQKIDRDAHKLITVQTLRISALIGVTGLGDLDGKPVGQWMAEVVAALGYDEPVEGLLDSMRHHAEPALAKILDPVKRRHTFVVGSMTGTQSMVSLVSNFEAFESGRTVRETMAASDVRVTSLKPKKPILVLAGAGDAVLSSEKEKLELMVRSAAPDSRVQEALAEVNAAVSKRTSTVSAGCHTASLHATGTGSATPFLTTEHASGFMPPETEMMFRSLGLKVNPKVGPDGKAMPIRFVGSSVARGGGSEDYFRAQLKLQPDSAELWNNYGSLLVSRRKWADAAVAYKKAISFDPAYVTAIANLAKVQWLHEGNLGRAEQLYLQAIEMAEPSVPSWILSDAAIFYDEGLRSSASARTLHERAANDAEYPLGKARLAYFAGTGYADGMWNLPSGKLEVGESVVTAVIREAREEVGVELDPGDVRMIAAVHHRNSAGVGRVGLVFLAHYDGRRHGAVRNAEPQKCAKVEWFPADKLPSETYMYSAQAIEAYRHGEPLRLSGWRDRDTVCITKGSIASETSQQGGNLPKAIRDECRKAARRRSGRAA